MKPAILATKGTADKKPPHGSPCNGCGLCCVATLCPAAQRVFDRGVEGPCPALRFGDDGRSSCGLVADPMRFRMKQTLQHGVEKMRRAALLLIGASTGCDARINGEPGNEAFYAELREWDRKNRSAHRAARTTWGL